MRRDFTATEIEDKFEEMIDAAYGDATIAEWVLRAAASEGFEVTDFATCNEVSWAADKLICKGIDLAAIIRRHH